MNFYFILFIIHFSLSPLSLLWFSQLSQQKEEKENKEQESSEQESSEQESSKQEPPQAHHSILIQLIAQELEIKRIYFYFYFFIFILIFIFILADQIRDFDLSVCDTQPACVGGAYNEFIFSPRLDNLFMSYTALMGLVNSTSEGLDTDSRIRMVALFDNEEIGSRSAYGAASNLLRQSMKRIVQSLGTGELKDALSRSFADSFLISADMAHAVHPNYSSKHEENHRPALHKGPVIKWNANQRYATTAPNAFLLKELARQHNVPLQEFVVRNDSACGSTIGPILSANCGVRTIDIGAPQLSMHSIRETAATDDIGHSINLFSGFFAKFTEIDSSLHSNTLN